MPLWIPARPTERLCLPRKRMRQEGQDRLLVGYQPQIWKTLEPLVDYRPRVSW